MLSSVMVLSFIEPVQVWLLHYCKLSELPLFLNELYSTHLGQPLNQPRNLSPRHYMAKPRCLDGTRSHKFPDFFSPCNRIPKKWKWTGPFHLDADKPALCTTRLHSLTGEQQGLRFSTAFQGVEKIEVTGLYDNVDLSTILPAFRFPSQLALLSPDGEEDTDAFKVLVAFLAKSKKVVIYATNES